MIVEGEGRRGWGGEQATSKNVHIPFLVKSQNLCISQMKERNA